MKKFQAFIKEVAEPKAGDEKRFKDKHIVNKTNYPGHDDDVGIYNGTKKSPAKKKRLADMEKGKDEEVYEEHDGEDDDDDDDDECPECGGEDGEHEEDCSLAEGMDPVNQKALKKKFSARKDKDIDNDGDVDSSDEYLHKRRKAISKAVKVDEFHAPGMAPKTRKKPAPSSTKKSLAAIRKKSEEVVVENYRQLALKGIGAETKNSITVGRGVDYYSPKDGSKHMGKITKVGKTDYELKDDKTGKTYKFKFWSKEAAAALKEEVVSETSSPAEMKKILKIIGPTKNAQQGIAAIKKALKVSDKKAEQLLDAAIKHSLGESQIDEISKELAGRYSAKASNQVGSSMKRNMSVKKVDNRYQGIKRASDRMAKRESIDEKKSEPLNEELFSTLATIWLVGKLLPIGVGALLIAALGTALTIKLIITGGKAAIQDAVRKYQGNVDSSKVAAARQKIERANEIAKGPDGSKFKSTASRIMSVFKRKAGSENTKNEEFDLKLIIKEAKELEEKKGALHLYDNEEAARKKAKEVGGKVIRGVGKSAGKWAVKEQVELDELKKSTLGSYIKRANVNTADVADANARGAKQIGKVLKRFKGVSQAADKLTGKAKVPATEEVIDEAQKLFMFKTKQEADQKAKEIKGKVLALGPKNFAVVTMDLTVVKEEEIFLAQFLLDEGVNVDDLTEEQLDELIGAVARGAVRGAVAVAKGAGRLAKRSVINKQGNVRFSTAGRADSTERRAGKLEKRKQDQERLKRAKERLKKAQDELRNSYVPEEMSDAQMKKREEIVKSMKSKTDDFKKRYGDRWKEVMYATATKQAMGESVQIDEISKELAQKVFKARADQAYKHDDDERRNKEIASKSTEARQKRSNREMGTNTKKRDRLDQLDKRAKDAKIRASNASYHSSQAYKKVNKSYDYIEKKYGEKNVPDTASDKHFEYKKKGGKLAFNKWKAQYGNRGEEFQAEGFFKVDIEGLPKFFMDAPSADRVKVELRKILKRPNDMITSIDRVQRAEIIKTFRLQAQGKGDDVVGMEPTEESVIHEGVMKLKDGSTIKLTVEQAKLLNNLYNNLNGSNKKKMEEKMMRDKTSFSEIINFAREAV